MPDFAKIEKEPFLYTDLPSLTNPAQPEDVVAGKQYIDATGEMQTGTGSGQVLVGNLLSVYKHTMQRGPGNYSGTLGGALTEINSNENLIGVSVRAKESYTPGELGMARLCRYDDETPQWEAKRYALHNYFDADSMVTGTAPSYVATVPLDGYTGPAVLSISGNKSDYFSEIHVLDADGVTIEMPVNRWTYVDPVHQVILTSGFHFTIPSNAVTLVFNCAGSLNQIQFTHGADEPTAIYPYGDGWEDIDNLEEEVILPGLSIYDYYTTAV